LRNILWDNFVVGQAHTFLRPIGFLSLAIDYRLFHLWAPGYHIVSVLLHLSSLAGLFFLARELQLQTEICVMTALFFSVLPINTEAVVWIACRFDQVATPLMLWSLFAYARFRRTGAIKFLWLALFFFLTALFSKENAFVLPVLVLLLELLIMRPPRYVPVSIFFGTAAACAIYRFWVLGGIGGYREPSGASSVLQIHTTTFKGLLLRAPAEMLFGVNWIQPPMGTTFFITATIAAVLFAILVYPLTVSRKMYWFAIGWMLIALLPAHSMVRIGADLGNSRELYFASAGAALLIALLLANVPQCHLRLGFCTVLAVLFACGAWHNLNAWQYDGAMSRQLQTEIVGLYPNPLPGTEFIIENLPRSNRGIYFFQTGLDDAVKLAYGRNDLRARRGSETEGSVERENPVVHLCWTGTHADGSLKFCPATSEPQ
jgi:hypothetical protein